MTPGHHVGRTRDVGYQIGARKTLPITVDEAWRLVVSKAGREHFLSALAALEVLASK